MSRTVQELVTEARGHLQDSREPYRYQDADFIGFANSALRDIRRLRPDFFVGTFADPFPEITALTDEWPLEETTELPVIYFFAGSAMLRDDEFAVDQRALSLVKTFSDMLVGDLNKVVSK
jgi:hypothetical protein